MAEKKYHANQLKNGTFICKVQHNGSRKSFYGKSEDEAINKAKCWYNEQLNQPEEKNESDEQTEQGTDINNEVVDVLNQIASLLEELKKPVDTDDVYMTVKEVGSYLRISLGQAYGLINQPDFPRQKIGKTYRVSRMELKEYLRKHRFSQIEV